MSISKKSGLIAGLSLLSIAAVSCQSTNAFPDHSAEIQTLEQRRSEASQAQMDVVAPVEYHKFSHALDEANYRAADHKDTTAAVQESQRDYAEMNDKAQATKVVLADVLAARQAAKTAEANKVDPKQFEKIDDDLMSATKQAAKGNIKEIQTSRNELRTRYLNAEADAIVEHKIGDSKRKLAVLRKDGADKKSPKTYDLTSQRVAESERNIRSSRHDTNVVDSASHVAAMEVAHLDKIFSDSKRLGTETAALELESHDMQAQADHQRLEQEKADLATRLNQDKADLSARLNQAGAGEQAAASELSRTNSELAQTQEQLAKADAVRRLDQQYQAARQQFQPDEADVYKDGSNLLIRLKSLNFAKGKSSIPSSDVAVLTKLQGVLQNYDGATLKIQGHTDATGSKTTNSRLSRERAEAVKNWLVAKEVVNSEDVSTEGVSDSKPLASNKSSEGRALNRSVDVIVTPAQTENR